MPAYKDNKTNKWFVQFRYTDWKGEKHATTKRGFATKREALEYERTFLEKKTFSLKMKLESFVDIYFEDKKYELKERTIKNKSYMINKYIIPCLGQVPIDEITTLQIVKWQNSMIEKNLSDTYLRMVNNQIVALFTHACKVYNLQNNPCTKINKLGKADAKHISYWTKEQYEKFIKTFAKDDKYVVLFDLLFWTGMRIGEALALNSNDFDFIKHEVNIEKTYYRSDGKDIVTSPKTEGSIRRVALPQFLEEEVKQYIFKLYKYPEDARLFSVGFRAVEAVMKRHTIKAELPRIRVHDLRHSHASLLINNGVQPKVISERLGHTDIRMTLNKYSHLYPSEQEKVVEQLNLLK